MLLAAVTTIMVVDTVGSYDRVAEIRAITRGLEGRDPAFAISDDGRAVCRVGICYFPGPGPGEPSSEDPRAILIARMRAVEVQTEQRFSFGTALQTRLRSLGTASGIPFALILGVLAFGGEWSSKTWPLLAVRDSRRRRLWGVRLAALGVAVVGGAVTVAGIATVADAVLRVRLGVPWWGGAGPASVVGAFLGVTVVLLFFAALGASAATLSRSGTAALVAVSGLVMVDWLAVREFPSLRYIAPNQQVAALFYRSLGAHRGARWFAPVGDQVCDPHCHVDLLSQPEPIAAAGVLIAIGSVFVALASTSFVRRELRA